MQSLVILNHILTHNETHLPWIDLWIMEVYPLKKVNPCVCVNSNCKFLLFRESRSARADGHFAHQLHNGFNGRDFGRPRLSGRGWRLAADELPVSQQGRGRPGMAGPQEPPLLPDAPGRNWPFSKLYSSMTSQNSLSEQMALDLLICILMYICILI